MFKGFGKRKEEDSIWVYSMVSSRDQSPAVRLTWGKQVALFTPAEARAHAFSIIEAASAAELDACLTQFLIEKLELSGEEANKVLSVYRHKRETEALPSVTMNMGNGQHPRPESVRQQCKSWIDASFGVEAEAFLAAFLMQDAGIDAERMEMMIAAFREMRGAVTLDVDEEAEENPNEAG